MAEKIADTYITELMAKSVTSALALTEYATERVEADDLSGAKAAIEAAVHFAIMQERLVGYRSAVRDQ